MKQAWAGVSLPPDIPLAKDQQWTVRDFSKGLVLADAPEDIPEGGASLMQDCEITRDDRLIRAPGVSQVESLVAHIPNQVVVHPGPAFKSELLFLSAPFLGVKSTGATVFTNVGLTGTPRYSFTNYAGILVFSNGISGTYSRKFGEASITKLVGAPSAQALAVFANRLILGATDINGSRDLMGVAWSGTRDYADWGKLANGSDDPDSEGQADQVLIGAMRQSDRIQAFAPLGFDTLAVINRRSIWIGNPTGDIWQPIRFAPRIEGTGCVSADTVQATEFGVIFLADDGVRIFTGNEAPVISDEINTDLIVDETFQYISAYDPARKRYYLITPAATFVLDVVRRRWFKWLSIFKDAAFFPTQGAAGITWGQAVGSWGSQTLAWWQMGGGTETGGKMFFLSATSLGNLGVEDPAALTVFNNALDPRWYDRKAVAETQDSLMTSQGIWLTYEADVDANIEIFLPDKPNGDYEPVSTATLRAGLSIKQSKIAHVPYIHTGRGVGFGVRIISGNPRIRRATTAFQETARLIEYVQIAPAAAANITLPLLSFHAVASVQDPVPISPGIMDSFSYMNLIAISETSVDEYAYMNPVNFARIIAAPYNGYTDRGDIPLNNREGIQRAYGLLYNGSPSPGSTTLMGRTFRFGALGVVNEIGLSFVINLNNKSLTAPMKLAKFFSATTAIPTFASMSGNAMNFELTTDRRLRFARYDSVGATVPVLIVGPSAAQMPATGFFRIDLRLLADNVSGSVKAARVDTIPQTVLLDSSGIVTTPNPGGGAWPFPIAYGGFTLDPDRTNTVSDGIIFHGVVTYSTTGLLPGQLLGDLACGTLQPSSNGDIITSASGGGFFGYPTLPDRWKNLLYGNLEGYVESPIPHGDEGNASVTFLNGQKDLYHFEAVNPAATSIIAVVPHFYAGRGGSHASPNIARMVMKSGGVELNGPNINIKYGNGGYQGGVPTPDASFTAIPKWVILNDPATGAPFTPTALSNVQFGWEVLTTQSGTTNYLSLLALEYVYRTT